MTERRWWHVGDGRAEEDDSRDLELFRALSGNDLLARMPPGGEKSLAIVGVVLEELVGAHSPWIPSEANGEPEVVAHPPGGCFPRARP